MRKARMSWYEVVNKVKEAIETFEAQGVKPTLRTIYYNLVSQNIIPNTKASYKYLSRIIVKARKEGYLPWDVLEDKTRVSYGYLADSRFDDNVLEYAKKRFDDILENLDFLKMITDTFIKERPFTYVDRWAEQEIAPEIWIEKEALAKTIERWTLGLNIPIRVNRGYSSWTFIYNNVLNLRRTLTKHKKVVIFYLGDLDPSGVDIQRFLKEALEYFGLDENVVEFKRLAITPEQVEKYNLPPRPEDAETLAKLERDTRTKSYKYDYIVELDALMAYVPEEFKRIVREAIMSVWDRETYEKLKERKEEIDRLLDEMISNYIEKAKEKLLEQLGLKGE